MAVRTWLVDLDGVVWLAGRAIPGSPEALASLRAAGERVGFFTNNSFLAHEEVIGRLGAIGVPVGSEDLLSSAQSAARLCEAGERVLVLGGTGIVEALAAREVTVEKAESEPTGPFDAVVVGLDVEFGYRRLAAAVRAVREGARLVATNEDPTYPTPEGLLPGAGSLLAALRTASGVEGVVAGKPHEPAAELIRERLGSVDIVAGDQPTTDGLLASRLGAAFGLVLSGVTRPDHGALAREPDEEEADLAALVSSRLSA